MSSRRRCIVVLDIGKTNVRVCAVDEAGQALHSVGQPNRSRPGPPYRHYDAEALFQFILDGLRQLGAEHEIEAIVPVTHGATAALLAGDDLALPVLDYEEEISSRLSAEYDARSRDFALTGSPSLPLGLNLGRQLYWLAGAFPDELSRVSDILLYPQYWAYRLCGVKASEVTSLGCHTDLWEPVGRRYSEVARAMGWDRLFPPTVAAWANLGTPTAEVRSRAGLASDCRVHAGIHDSNASFLAHRVPRDGDFCVVSSGTWIICMAHGASMACLRGDRDMLANVDAFGDPVPSARFMGGREYAAIAGSTTADPTADEARAVVASGAMALPAFAAEGGPFLGRTGRLVRTDSARALDRAALAAVYCALVTDYCIDLLGARGEILVEGKFAANRAYVATLAGLRPGQTVSVSSDQTGTLSGAVLLARLPEAASGDLPRSRRVEPIDPELLAGYRRDWRARVDGEDA